jgi:hypothetical protein
MAVLFALGLAAQAGALSTAVWPSVMRREMHALPSHPRLQRVHGDPTPVFIIPGFLTTSECEALVDACHDLQEVRYIEPHEDKLVIGWSNAMPGLLLLAIAGVAGLVLGADYTLPEALQASAGAVAGASTLASMLAGRAKIFTGTKWDATGHAAEEAFLTRIAALFGNVSRERFEPVTVTRYRQGEYQRKHIDARLDGMRDDTFDAGGGQRIAQIIVYLRAPEAGGETKFFGKAFSDWSPPRAVAPVVGQALVFPTATIDGVPDQRYLHSGETVRRGEKWIVGTWLVQDFRH